MANADIDGTLLPTKIKTSSRVEATTELYSVGHRPVIDIKSWHKTVDGKQSDITSTSILTSRMLIGPKMDKKYLITIITLVLMNNHYMSAIFI